MRPSSCSCQRLRAVVLLLAACMLFLIGVLCGIARPWGGSERSSWETDLPLQLQAIGAATDKEFAMCTGPVDNAIEAVYLLDFVTGDLKATVINKRSGRFTAFFTYNVTPDVGPELKNPRYVMVTALADMQRGAGPQIAKSVLFVAEATTGKVAAYVLPWNSTAQATGVVQAGAFIPLDIQQFRTTALRDR